MLDAPKYKDVKIASVEGFLHPLGPCSVSMVFPTCVISSGAFGPLGQY